MTSWNHRLIRHKDGVIELVEAYYSEGKAGPELECWSAASIQADPDEAPSQMASLRKQVKWFAAAIELPVLPALGCLRSCCAPKAPAAQAPDAPQRMIGFACGHIRLEDINADDLAFAEAISGVKRDPDYKGFPVRTGRCSECLASDAPPTEPYAAPTREQIFALVAAELERAYSMHGELPWSPYQFFGVLSEEVDELWDDIKIRGPKDLVRGAVIQVLAMCVRYYETGNHRYVGGPSRLSQVHGANARPLREQIFSAICGEAEHASAQHGRGPWPRHEFYALLRRKVDGLWTTIISDDAQQEDVLRAGLAVAGVCLRYYETGER